MQKKPCISVCTESLPNYSSVTCYAVILTDIHGSKEDLELLGFFLKRI